MPDQRGRELKNLNIIFLLHPASIWLRCSSHHISEAEYGMWSEKASNWAVGDIAGSVLAMWWIYRFNGLMPGDPASGGDPCSINCEHAPYWTCGRCTLQNLWPVPEFFFFWSQLWAISEKGGAAMSGGVMRWSVSSVRSLNSNSASACNIDY